MTLLCVQWQYYKAWMRQRVERALGLPRTPYMQALGDNRLPTSLRVAIPRAFLTGCTAMPGQHGDAQLLAEATEGEAVSDVTQLGRKGPSKWRLPEDVMDALLTKVPGNGPKKPSSKDAYAGTQILHTGPHRNLSMRAGLMNGWRRQLCMPPSPMPRCLLSAAHLKVVCCGTPTGAVTDVMLSCTLPTPHPCPLSGAALDVQLVPCPQVGADELELLVRHPLGLAAQAAELLCVPQLGGQQALADHQVDPPAWEEVQALAELHNLSKTPQLQLRGAGSTAPAVLPQLDAPMPGMMTPSLPPSRPSASEGGATTSGASVQL
jgi:hypothetical protein